MGSGATPVYTASIVGLAHQTTCLGSLERLTESFESGLGDWTTTTSGSLGTTWKRLTGPSPNPNTGPTAASAGSFYIYFDSSESTGGATLGDSATLEGYISVYSTYFRVARVLEFDYHMYGVSTGRLEVVASFNSGFTPSTVVWSRSGDQGNGWKRARVSLAEFNTVATYLHIKFIATETYSGSFAHSGDIALDNIQFFNAEDCPSCAVALTPSGTGLTVSPSALSLSCASISQTFTVTGPSTGTFTLAYSVDGPFASRYPVPSSVSVTVIAPKSWSISSYPSALAYGKRSPVMNIDIGSTASVTITPTPSGLLFTPPSFTFTAPGAQTFTVLGTRSSTGPVSISYVFSGPDALLFPNTLSSSAIVKPGNTFVLPAYPDIANGVATSALSVDITGCTGCTGSGVTITPSGTGLTFSPSSLAFTTPGAQSWTVTGTVNGQHSISYTISGGDVPVFLDAIPSLIRVTGPLSFSVPSSYPTTTNSVATAALPVSIDISGIAPCMANSESFETSFGVWVTPVGGGKAWHRHSGSTSSSSTGPSVASDGSTYIYFETSSGSGDVGDTATLSSTFDFTTRVAPVLEFDYHMYGSTIGDLDVKVSSDGGSTFLTLWTISGEQGNAWKHAKVSLATYAGVAALMVRIVALETFDHYYGDIALDKIELYDASACAVCDTTIVPSGTGLSFSPTSLSFTCGNAATPQSWTVTGTTDGAQTISYSVGGSFGGSYAIPPTNTITITP